MVSSEHQKWLYVAIPVYFCMLAASAVWAFRRMEQMNHSGVSDKLSSHYLGGRSFGPLLTAGTVFASLFSGYTVVGIPNEAYKLGWYAIRWLPSTAMIGFGYYGTGMRLRKASVVRNHQSPVDLITDRYQSQFLRYTIVALQVLTSTVYLAAQVIAIKSTFNSMFEIDDTDANWPVILIMAVILVFEWMGGLSSVALTDCIQGLIMLISFVVLPVIVKIHFGGWTELDPESYPKPELYETLTSDQQWQFWQFSLINFSFFTLPHFVQRVYAAKDLVSLKAGYSVVVIGPWITMLVGVYLGTVGVQMLDGADVASPFTSILEEVMKFGGFAEFTGILAFTASLAAIMSTADSLIIAISQLVTVEVLYPMAKSKSPGAIAMMGRCVSLVAVAIALIVGIFWKSGISDLGAIQFPLTMQVVPTFLFALFATSKATDIHPWCLATSAWVAVGYVFGVYFGYISSSNDPAPIDAGITGLALQITLLVLLESTRRLLCAETTDCDDCPNDNQSSQLWYPNRPAFDVSCTKRFGGRPLTPSMLWNMMDGVHEPMTNLYFVAFMLFSVSIITPLVPGGIPNGPIENVAVINGMPWWAFKALILCIIPYAMSLFAVWRMPNKFPAFDDGDNVMKLARPSLDPDLVELSRQELGKRTSYDATNIVAALRRNSIRKSLQGLTILKDNQETNMDSVRQLSSLIHPDETEGTEKEMSA